MFGDQLPIRRNVMKPDSRVHHIDLGLGPVVDKLFALPTLSVVASRSHITVLMLTRTAAF